MQTRSTSTNASADSPITASKSAPDEELTGEDAVRRAANAVINRSAGSDGKRVRRRSRKARSTPLLDSGGLKFHYAVGGLIVFSLLAVIFRDKVGHAVWKLLHPPAPAVAPGTPGAAGAVASAPAGPPPWWFHPEVLALLVGLVIWLYLTPGVWNSVKIALGLKKDKENRSRRRHN